MNENKPTKNATPDGAAAIDAKVLERQRKHMRRALLKRRRKKSGQ